MPEISGASLIAVFTGGGAGSVMRFLLSKFSAGYLGEKFPYGTLIANTLGALIAGYVAILIFERRSLTAPWSDFLLAGFLGGLTTFSSMVLDAHRLFAASQAGIALLYLTINLAAGFLLFHLAFATARAA